MNFFLGLFIKISIKKFIPPIIIQLVHYFRFNSIKFSDQFKDWNSATLQSYGYDSDSILDKVLESTLAVKNGLAAFERDSVLFDHIEYDWPIATGLMWAAARNGRLNVLDFGGALGSSYFQNRTFITTLPDVRWSVVEQNKFVVAGRKSIQDEILKFYFTIDECLSENNPNVILLSSVLQYLPNIDLLLKDLLKVDAQILLIDKTIINYSKEDRVHIQIVPSSIYEASYPCWSLSESKLLNVLSAKYQLISKFSSIDFPALCKINSVFNGYLFLRSVNEKTYS